MRCQAEQTGMRRQGLVIPRCMLNSVRPRQQLGEDEDGNEKQMTQGIHSSGLIDLDE